MTEVEMLINGESRPGADGRTFTTYEPARGTSLAEVARATTDDVAAVPTLRLKSLLAQ